MNFPALDLARSYASNTLVYRQEEKETWNKALAHAGEALSEARPLSLELIQYWNQLLRNEFSGPPLRELDQSLVGRNLLGGAHVGQALEEFDKYVLEVEEEPVLKASRIYQWLISIHPFPQRQWSNRSPCRRLYLAPERLVADCIPNTSLIGGGIVPRPPEPDSAHGIFSTDWSRHQSIYRNFKIKLVR